ncbi:MAG: DNA/RNA nuclease SfsA [Clostridia bacterium]|nr:DNA/RNA nuclease SfsA [Clostridia bacterium]
MKYKNVVKGKFISRPNRFIAYVDINGIIETVHVKNTGRCRELLVEGATVYLSLSDNPLRRTKYDLIAVEKERNGKAPLLINMDSQIPNSVCEEWLKKGELFSRDAVIRREYTYKSSRFDFYIEDGKRKIFLEVKGCTLEKDGIASFPDAPTERGVKHINELIRATEDGYEAYVFFVIQMKEMKELRPNDITHREFGEALRIAYKSGVKIIAYDCTVSPCEITIDKEIKVNLHTGEGIL